MKKSKANIFNSCEMLFYYMQIVFDSIKTSKSFVVNFALFHDLIHIYCIHYDQSYHFSLAYVSLRNTKIKLKLFILLHSPPAAIRPAAARPTSCCTPEKVHDKRPDMASSRGCKCCETQRKTDSTNST